MKQLEHHNTTFTKVCFPIVLVLDGIHSPANIGSLFRIAEAFGVAKILACGVSVNLESPRLKKTARSTIPRVPFEQHLDCMETCKGLSESGYRLLALEITATSKSLDQQDFSKHERLALVIGHENTGVGQEVLDLCENHLHISMFGDNSSMNVVQATGIALYQITKSLPPIK